MSNDSVTNVAKLLMDVEDSGKFTDTYTLIDVTNKNDTISMISVGRVGRKIEMDDDIKSFIGDVPDSDKIDHILNHAWSQKDRGIGWVDRIWNEQRTDVKIGRYSKRIINIHKTIPIKDSDIEVFVNYYKSSFDYNKGLRDRLSIVKGDDIKHWYLEENYEPGGGSLNNSCMRYEKCQKYLDIYSLNPEVCSMLILKSENGKLLARSLVWVLKNGSTYMDRVYTSKDSDSNIFKDYAKERGWLTYYTGGGKNLSVGLGDHSFEKYPYMDTFIWYNKSGDILSSVSERGDNDWYELQNTDGSFSNSGGIWSEYHQEYVGEDEAVWCENINSYVHNEEAIWLEYRQEWAGPDSDVVWSAYENESFYREDTFRSRKCLGEDVYISKDRSVRIKIGSGSTSNDGEYDYCPTNRRDIYFKLGDELFSRKNYVKDPYSGEYVFLDSIVDGKRFAEYFVKKIQLEIGDIGDGEMARKKLYDLIVNILTNIPTDAINFIDDCYPYKQFSKYMRTIGYYDIDILSPKGVLYYVLSWSVNNRKFDGMHISTEKIRFAIQLVNKIISLSPKGLNVDHDDGELFFSEKIADMSQYHKNGIISNLSNISREFDYYTLGSEFQKLYLYLSLF